MVFRIQITLAGGGWQARYSRRSDASWAIPDRSGTLGPKGYPIPPVAETSGWEHKPWSRLCDHPDDDAARGEALELFRTSDPRYDQQDVAALGGYLFWILLGRAWEAIRSKADGKSIRLELELPSEFPWQALPWEMLWGPQGPLSALDVAQGGTVSFSRIVTGLAAPDQANVDLPLKVLFVVGREADNQLRPGAEYLGLLRRLNTSLPAQPGTPGGSFGIALHTRLLHAATAAELASAVKEFQPAVVHLVSHGEWSGSDAQVLLTQYENESARTKPKPDPVDAERLAKLLDPKPQALVLNACNTARSGDVQPTFAEQMVRFGVPLVIGMAGEVADSACRFFSHAFYKALYEERPADLAAAAGRRAALLQIKSLRESYDWARAVLYQIDGLEMQFKVRSGRQLIARVAEELRPKQNREAFCGRTHWFQVFHQVLSRQIKNLAIESEDEPASELNSTDKDKPQLGKTRLLEELRWVSVLEDWLPVIIGQRVSKGASVLYAGMQLNLELDRERGRYGLKARIESKTLKHAAALLGISRGDFDNDEDGSVNFRSVVLQKLTQQSSIQNYNREELRKPLSGDLLFFLNDVSAIIGQRKGVLILWDQIDQHDVVGEELIALLDVHGLGSQECPAPMVFTYSPKSPSGQKLRNSIKSSFIFTRALGPFSADEGPAACSQYLSYKALVQPRQRNDYSNILQALNEELKGYPSNFGRLLDQYIRFLCKTNTLIACNDEDLLNQV